MNRLPFSLNRNDAVGEVARRERSAAFTPLYRPPAQRLLNTHESFTLKRHKCRAPRAGNFAWCALVLLAAIFVASRPAAEASTYVTADRLWTNGVVPFRWDPQISIPNRVRVVIAMNIWQAVANVTFVPRTNETDYVLIQDADDKDGSRSDSIGRNGNVQNLYIRTNLAGITDYGLAHELGHVLGFYHTHQRPDRDMFITWYTNRTDTNKVGNFTIEPTALGYPRNAMDYASVMSYPRCTFTTCADCGVFCEDCPGTLENCRVLKIKDPAAFAEFDSQMGQRTNLTRIDTLVMSFMYPQPGWRFVEAVSAGSSEKGEFHNPYLTLHKALTNAPNNATLWVQPGSYKTGMAVISKPLTLRGPIGNVVVRRN